MWSVKERKIEKKRKNEKQYRRYIIKLAEEVRETRVQRDGDLYDDSEAPSFTSNDKNTVDYLSRSSFFTTSPFCFSFSALYRVLSFVWV